MPRDKTVLITGASSGIGAALARVFAAKGHDLILVARRAEKLEALATDLKTAHGATCTVIAADLADSEAPQHLFDAVVSRALEVDILVNNAGILERGTYCDIELADHVNLIQVNVAAPAALARLFLVPMLERGHGRILNVASTSAFQPAPGLATYAASKAFLLSLSEALWIETRGKGVTVTALCPGFTNTDMIAGEGGAKPMSLPLIRNMDASEVAQQGYDACMAGKAIHINGFGNRLMVETSRHQPWPLRRWAIGIASRFI